MIIYFFPFQMEENDAFLDAEVKYQKMKNKECYGVKASHKTPLSFLKRKRLVRTVLIFTESSDQLSRATDRVPGLPASPGYVQ